MDALTRLGETNEEFALRRIQWAALCYREEQVRPSFRRLADRAGMQTRRLKWSIYQDMINNALTEIDLYLNMP